MIILLKAHRGQPFCCRAVDAKRLHFVCGLRNPLIVASVMACLINQRFHNIFE